eukprot:gnl/TRDRNA2_/TRDRNA2_173005_c2_seq1.p1 gnl/TRDRNA2_/TRDRNA2_173005_c2~~gnl/TRDRNA2_/TRDRNA2_173005_c2_seq1.p1  ORF type:complete len:279 (+),score=38.64 gnl/TRDRNA2_/TRDRNA2_173005_c2_seq1:63-839(+)
MASPIVVQRLIAERRRKEANATKSLTTVAENDGLPSGVWIPMCYPGTPRNRCDETSEPEELHRQSLESSEGDRTIREVATQDVADVEPSDSLHEVLVTESGMLQCEDDSSLSTVPSRTDHEAGVASPRTAAERLRLAGLLEGVLLREKVGMQRFVSRMLQQPVWEERFFRLHKADCTLEDWGHPHGFNREPEHTLELSELVAVGHGQSGRPRSLSLFFQRAGSGNNLVEVALQVPAKLDILEWVDALAKFAPVSQDPR